MARASPASCLYRHNRHSLTQTHACTQRTCSPQASVALGLATVYSQSNTSKLFWYKFDQTDSEFRNITFHFQTVQAPPPFPLCCGPTWGTLLKRHQFISRLLFQTSTLPFCKLLCHMLGSIRGRTSLWALSLCHKQGNNIKSISGEEEQGTLGEFKTLYCP